MKNFFLQVMIGVGFIFPGASFAAISVDSVIGKWTSVNGTNTASGVGTNEIRWGIPANEDQSGYRFDGFAPPAFNVNIGEIFSLGDFTHFNEPIRRYSITGARLETTLDLTIDGQVLNDLSFVYDFLHNETTNEAPCLPGSASVCDDLVQIVNNEPLSDSFNINGVDYTVKILGFEINDTLFEQFLTQEGKTNIATLKAIVTAREIPVPEPATYLLLSIFLIGVCLRSYSARKGRV